MKAIATAAFLLTSTFASAQELTEEQKKALIEFALKAQQKQKEDAELKEKNDALIEKHFEEERAAYEKQLVKDKKWCEVSPINPDELTGKPQGFSTFVFNQELTSESKECYQLRIDLTNEKVLDKFIIQNNKYRFPFDVKNIRMVFHKGGDAVSVPVRRADTTDKALIIDNPLAVERVFDLLEAQGYCKMELKMSYKFDTITRVVSFDTSNIPKEIIVER